MSETKEGIIVILSSPSGAGKTTLVKEISKRNNVQISITHTTRKPRSNETDGKDYYFVEESEFKNLIDKDKFLEYAQVTGFIILIALLLFANGNDIFRLFK